jgi:ribonucleoside-diphosphate reductase beta chain
MACDKILCLDKKPTDSSLFFGKDFGGFLRIDQIQYPQLWKLAQASESNTWFTEEIDCTEDAKHWDKIPEIAREMFLKNNGYQSVQDSGVSNIFFDIAKMATVPELIYLYNRIGIEENIHAFSYSKALADAWGSQAEEMIDIVYRDKVIQTRMDKEIDAAIYLPKILSHSLSDDERNKYFLKMILRIYALEGVKFPFSFFTSFTINRNYDNALQGITRVIKLIAHDEMTTHTTTGKSVLNILRKESKHGLSYLFDSGWFDETATSIFKETAELEFDWNKYLLINGPIEGYNEEIGRHFIKYWTDERLKQIKCDIIYNEKKSDIIDWFNDYKDINKQQAAPQESDILAYQKGKLKNDLDTCTW